MTPKMRSKIMTSKRANKLEALELAHFVALANEKEAQLTADFFSEQFYTSQLDLSVAQEAVDEAEKALLKFKEKNVR